MSQDRLKVLVWTVDPHIRMAAQALDSHRFELLFPLVFREALTIIESGCGVGIVDLEPNGFALVKEMRGSRSASGARIVMICERPQDGWLCRQAGADEVLLKPLFDPVTLTNCVDLATKKPA